ncbi:kinase-like domain-containing protein [Zopfochytrium polystomum]|nr:kinase-like domain-containing protein [Zopfochytrium polystomum]
MLALLNPHDHHHHHHDGHSMSIRADSGYASSNAALSTPPASPDRRPFARPKTVSAESLRLLELADSASDAAFTDANTLKARRAVRYAVRHSAHLDAFRIDRILGYGSNGVVVAGHLADDSKQQQQPVAIKIIYKAAQHVGKQNQPMPREIQLIKLLADEAYAHQGLLHAFDAWQDDRHFYLVTELFGSDWLAVLFDPATPAAPEDLLVFFNPRRSTTHTVRVSPGSADVWAWSIAQRHHNEQSHLRRHPGAAPETAPLPDPRHVRQVFRKAVAAVHHLHRVANTAHGDIKEENVLVQSVTVPCADPDHADRPQPHWHHALDVRVCDFGHAVRGADGKRPTLTSYGTAHSTPPELQDSRRQGAATPAAADGFAADVFALGVLLFALLHGPGRAPSILEAAAAARGSSSSSSVRFPASGPLPIADDVDPRVPPECVEILEGMTMVRPEQRWTLDRVLEHPWMRG